MDLKFSSNDFENFGEAFLSKYLQNGFCSMPKREVDILVFYLLRKTRKFKSLSVHDLSTQFRVPESKIKSFILEGELRHGKVNHKAIIGCITERYIKKLRAIDLKDGYCEVALDDPIEKREFEHAVKVTGHHVEYGINRDILKIKPIRLLEIILNNVEKGETEFIELVKTVIKDQKKQTEILKNPLGFRDKLNKLGNEVSDKASLISLLATASGMLLG